MKRRPWQGFRNSGTALPSRERQRENMGLETHATVGTRPGRPMPLSEHV